MIIWAAAFFLYLTRLQGVESGDTKYVAVYKDEISECDDPGSSVIDFSDVSVIQESGSDTYVTGDVTFYEDVEEGTQVKAEVSHEVDGNDEYVFGIVSNICQEMNNTETPWYPIINGMGIVNCPIKKGVYHMEKVSLDISEFSDYMKQEYCGDYTAEISFLYIPNDDDVIGGAVLPKVLSCHIFVASIFESKE